jgi:hypothetical protein
MVVVFTTTYAVCQWFSPGTPVSSINKTDRHDITEIIESGVKHHILNHNPVLNLK